MYFQVGNTQRGDPAWWLYADDNQMVAWAGETYATSLDARRACESFKAGAASARYEIYADTGSQWRWRVWRSSDKVASSGEVFAGEYEAERAATNVRDNAGTATGP